MYSCVVSYNNDEDGDINMYLPNNYSHRRRYDGDDRTK